MKSLLTFLFVVIGLNFLVSCSKDDDNPVNSNSEKAKIGVIASFTGSEANRGKMLQTVVNIALRDINSYLAQAGSSHRFEAKFEDVALDTMLCKTKLQSMINEGIKVFIGGPNSSFQLKSIYDLIQSENVLMLNTFSSATSLAIKGDNIFRFIPDDSRQSKALRRLIVNDSMKVIIPLYRDDNYGNELVSELKTRFSETGGICLDGAKYSISETDFSAVIQTVKQQLAQALSQYPKSQVCIVITAFNEFSNIFALAANDEELKSVKWYGCDGLSLSDLLTSSEQLSDFAINVNLNTSAISMYGLDIKKRIAAEVYDSLQLQTDPFSLAAYDAVWIFALSYLAAGDCDIDKIKLIIPTTAEKYIGAGDRKILNEAGDIAFSVFDFWYVIKENGKYVWKQRAAWGELSDMILYY